LESTLRRAVERHRALIQIREMNESLDYQNAELQEMNRQLDQKNEELETAKNQLDQKNKRLAKLYEMAQQFVDNVSHDFRTPLTVIKEYVAIMRDGLTGTVADQHRKFLEIINDRADDLAVMVDDMLDLSRLDAGLLRVWRRRCRLDDVFKHVRPILERKAELKETVLDVSVEEGLPLGYFDPDKIGRVIVNLMVNAIKFSGQGGRVSLRARRAANPAEIMIEVEDNGPGIAPESLRNLYERFHQVESPRRFKTDGFGLGLSISKELVGLNFGEIAVESELERGSTFSFTVPIWDPQRLVSSFLDRIDQINGKPTRISLLGVTVESQVEPALSGVVDEFLQRQIRGHDLVLAVSRRKWFILTQCPRSDLPKMIGQIQAGWAEHDRNMPEIRLPELKIEVRGAWSGKKRNETILKQYEAERSSASREPAGPKVLLADDDHEFVEAMEIRLRANGYEVLTAFDGQTAVDLALEHHPDAILIDNYMPLMSGVEAITELGAHCETMEIPVIVISAGARDQQDALSQGANYFFKKPCDVNVLTAALREVIAEPIRAGVE
jgi:signal transduction histidine kinase/CheY-like chemotaxis protein